MQPNDKSLDINDKIIEILVEILERCGVWNNHGRDDPTSWNQVSKSLDQLSSNVEKLATMQIKSDRVIEILLAIEQDIQDVRAQSKLILQEQQDISEVLSLCRELERIGGRAENHRMLPLSLSLSSFVRNQRLDVMDTLKQVDQYLSTLYEALAPEKSSKLDLVQRLRVIAKDLDQRCIQPNSPPWSDAKEFVKVLLSRRSRCDPRLTLDKPEQDSRIHTEEHTPSETTGSSSSYSTPASSNGLVRFETVIEMALAFANQNMAPSIANRCILLVGSEGSGKSFCLDQIQKQTPKTVNVIRPSLPYDAIGRKVGSAEDLLISMVTYGVQRGDKSIVLLDDIESVCGNNYEESTPSPMGGEATTTTGISNEPHLIARCRCLLLSLLEIVRLTPMDHVMLICTARNNWGKSIDRFDQVFVLENPSTHDRMKLFRYYIAKLQCQDDDDCKIDDSLSNLVECTSGLQYAELAFHCRGAMLEAIRAKASPLDFLRALKGQLQQAIPESLKTGAISDFVDMRVLTLRDFLDRNVLPHADSDLSAAFQCPLYGSSVEYAWEELQRLIITPLCKAGKLHDLMFHDGSSGGKIFAGGVLLAGLPGSGKSMLAYQCAALAALKNPSVKLLDVSCTSLIHKQLGSSEQAIHRLFTIAKSAAPCILLMDGIENVAAVRGNDNTTEGTMDRVLSTLLTELDGVDSQAISAENPACIAIIGITHNPEWVDPALRRPGRLERVIELGFPELDARQKIVERELSGIAFEGFMTSAASLIAEQTEGFSGAAVVGVCNEAKIRASTDTLITADADNCPYAVTLHHINDAIASQLAGK